MATSPTQLTLRQLRREGWEPEVVERYNHFSRKKNDLFGFGDVLALKEGERALLVQCTSDSNHAARRKKALALDRLPLLRAAFRVEVWSWRKAKGRWRERREAL